MTRHRWANDHPRERGVIKETCIHCGLHRRRLALQSSGRTHIVVEAMQTVTVYQAHQSNQIVEVRGGRLPDQFKTCPGRKNDSVQMPTQRQSFKTWLLDHGIKESDATILSYVADPIMDAVESTAKQLWRKAGLVATANLTEVIKENINRITHATSSAACLQTVVDEYTEEWRRNNPEQGHGD